MNYDVELLRAVVIGAVQGVTEFLPISSDGHLVIVRQIFSWPDQGLFFDITIHLATLLAVIIYFWRDCKSLISSWLERGKLSKAQLQNRQLTILLGWATLPVIPAALIMLPIITDQTRNLPTVGSLMILSGVAFWLIQKFSRPRRDISRLTRFDAIAIGLAQAMAILPGVSRSGSTIAASLYQGIKVETAARFSFLLAIPAIAGAGVVAVIEIMIQSAPLSFSPLHLGAAFVTAFIFGLASIHLLLYLLKRLGLTPFAYYMVVAGLALLALNYFDVRFSWLA